MRERLERLFIEHILSYDKYPWCVSTGNYRDEMIHWLHYHRWYDPRDLSKIFAMREQEVMSILNLRYRCHPTLKKFKD